MATSFKDIYKRFLFSIEDDGIANLEKRDFYDLLQNYITQGSILDFRECRKSLDYSEGKVFENTYIGDGVTREFLIYNPTINEMIDAIVLVNGEIVDKCFYIIVNDDEYRVEGGFEIPEIPDDMIPTPPIEEAPEEAPEEIPGETPEETPEEPPKEEPEEEEIQPMFVLPDDEPIDEGFSKPHIVDKYIQFAYPIEEGAKVKVILKELGYFKEDLTTEEILIIAETMKLHWIRRQIMREDNLKASISTADFKKTSNANLLDKLLMLEEKTEKNLREYKVNYSMEGFEGFY